MLGASQPDVLGEFYAGVLDRPADMKEEGWYGWQIGGRWLSIGEHSEVKGQAKEPQRLVMNFETKEVKEEVDRNAATGATVGKEPDDNQGVGNADMAEPAGNHVQHTSPRAQGSGC